MEVLSEGIRPREVFTVEALHNAFARMALAGSTYSVLHLISVAHEAGLDFPLSSINEISDS